MAEKIIKIIKYKSNVPLKLNTNDVCRLVYTNLFKFSATQAILLIKITSNPFLDSTSTKQ